MTGESHATDLGMGKPKILPEIACHACTPRYSTKTF